MRKLALLLSLAAITAVPSLADAKSACEARAAHRTTTGTLIGAGAGALVGNAIQPKGGALWGGAAGAVAGNQIARTKCYSHHHHYRGYYYRDGHRVYYR
jgi:hypothetical protein